MSTQRGNHRTSGDAGADTIALRADLLGEPPGSALRNADAVSSAVKGLPRGSALLVVRRGPNAGSRFMLHQPITSAGRHPGADVFLDDVTVSRHHAEFRLENGEFRVVDVGSLNGTYVNREPVESAVLADGDEIQLGKFRLAFTAPTTG
jgi:pSer/pThr/pTyr-binding forkhead associated (FHA) protein